MLEREREFLKLNSCAVDSNHYVALDLYIYSSNVTIQNVIFWLMHRSYILTWKCILAVENVEEIALLYKIQETVSA